MPEPQVVTPPPTSPQLDYAALADQARRTQSGQASPAQQTDYNALADQVRKAVPAGPITPANRPPTTMERVESTYPAVGAVVGGIIGGAPSVGFGAAPGAAFGGATGAAVKSLSRTIRTGGQVTPPKPTTHVPFAGDVLPSASGLIGQPPPNAGPLRAGLQTSAQEAADIGQTAAEQYGLQKGADLVGAIVRGPFRPPSGPATDLAKTNEKLGLGLTAPELAGPTTTGVVGRSLQNVAERSLSGRAIAVTRREVGRQNALRGVASGQEALRRTGEALGQTVKNGPAYDMLPHQVEAARIFGEEIAPKILDLKTTLPAPVIAQLQAATRGGLSPQLALRAVRATKAAIQKGSKEAVPIGSLDTLEKILATRDSINFSSGTALRTGLIETGKKGDAILGERGTALARKFTGDLTDGMSQSYPDWDPLRALYAKGAQGLEHPEITRLVGEAPPEALATAQKQAAALPVGQETDVINNLRYIGEALDKVKRTPDGWTRVYNAFELASVVGAGVTHGPIAAAGAASAVEILPGMVAWAAHSPTMTKFLTQGLTSKNPAQAAALLARVYGAYEAQHQPIKMAPSHQVGQPPPQR